MAAATGGRLVAVGAAAALLVGAGAGCATEYDGGADLVTADPGNFEASPGYVADVVDASSSDSYRYTMSFSFNMGGQSLDAELATGAVDGERSQVDMDFGALFEEMGSGFGEDLPPELVEADLTMQQITDTGAIYIRAPFFSAIAEQAEREGEVIDMTSEPGGELLEVYSQLGDSWGRVDLDALGDVLPSEAQQALGGGQNGDPRVFLDMLRETAAVEELGIDEIDGVEVQGLAADVDLGDLMAASGTDPADLSVDTGSGSIDMASFSFPLEVWIDRDDRVRRIDFTFGADAFADLAEESGEDVGDMPSELDDFSIGMTMDFSDYGDDSISIDTPSDAVDITDEFVAAYDELYGG
jgi:hypothetical protein